MTRNTTPAPLSCRREHPPSEVVAVAGQAAPWAVGGRAGESEGDTARIGARVAAPAVRGWRLQESRALGGGSRGPATGAPREEAPSPEDSAVVGALRSGNARRPRQPLDRPRPPLRQPREAGIRP